MRPEVLSCTPSLYHDKEGSGLPDAEHSIEAESPTIVLSFSGISFMILTGSIKIKLIHSHAACNMLVNFCYPKKFHLTNCTQHNYDIIYMYACG